MPAQITPAPSGASVRVVRKTVDGTAVNNSTALVNDSVLLDAVPASSVRRFRGVLFVSGPTGADMDLAFADIPGASIKWSRVSERTTDTSATTGGIAADVATAFGQRLPVGTFGVGVQSMVTIQGVLRTAGTAGNLQLQRSQAVAVVGDTLIHADSWLELIADPQ